MFENQTVPEREQFRRGCVGEPTSTVQLLDNERGARRVEGAFGRVARTGELSSERNCLQLQVVVESETPAGGAGGARTRVVGAVVVGPVARTGPGRFFP